METFAVVFEAPKRLALSRVRLDPADPTDVVVDVRFSGISTGTERLLWEGRMPAFPGLGYPLVPGYESVGYVRSAPADGALKEGDFVFVPGASCYADVRGLFGGAAARVVVPEQRLIKIPERLASQGTLLALAATAHHAIRASKELPELIVGHGVLGRLLARLVGALGGNATVWERDEARRDGAQGYAVVDPNDDPRRDYRCICEAGGSAQLDAFVSRLAPKGELTLAGFYSEQVSFTFPPAFMRETRFQVAAEWKPEDMTAVLACIEDGRLQLDGLITHQSASAEASDAYRTAFEDPRCLKMLIDWSSSS